MTRADTQCPLHQSENHCLAYAHHLLQATAFVGGSKSPALVQVHTTLAGRLGRNFLCPICPRASLAEVAHPDPEGCHEGPAVDPFQLEDAEHATGCSTHAEHATHIRSVAEFQSYCNFYTNSCLPLLTTCEQLQDEVDVLLKVLQDLGTHAHLSTSIHAFGWWLQLTAAVAPATDMKALHMLLTISRSSLLISALLPAEQAHLCMYPWAG